MFGPKIHNNQTKITPTFHLTLLQHHGKIWPFVCLRNTWIHHDEPKHIKWNRQTPLLDAFCISTKIHAIQANQGMVTSHMLQAKIKRTKPLSEIVPKGMVLGLKVLQADAQIRHGQFKTIIKPFLVGYINWKKRSISFTNHINFHSQMKIIILIKKVNFYMWSPVTNHRVNNMATPDLERIEHFDLPQNGSPYSK